MKAIHTQEQDNAEAIIAQCKICHIGLADTDGTPYVLPMNFGYSDGVIYLHSGPEGSHLDILGRNNKICITFSTGDKLVYQDENVACSYSMRSDSVICRGKVEFVEDLEEKTDAMNILMANYTDRKFTYSNPAIMNVKVWKVEVESFNTKSFGLTYKEYLKRVNQ
ncbi:MAG: pyridoxamine 5'-phosphate oxidase family protein [Bacteroidota bacterium]|nr:pyridoxamine 5'-phosphate oxidase family protein [Bacteroidota bacterium]